MASALILVAGKYRMRRLLEQAMNFTKDIGPRVWNSIAEANINVGINTKEAILGTIEEGSFFTSDDADLGFVEEL